MLHKKVVCIHYMQLFIRRIRNKCMAESDIFDRALFYKCSWFPSSANEGVWLSIARQKQGIKMKEWMMKRLVIRDDVG